MENDENKTTDCKTQPEEDRHNRRQFFNGFGKWSLAIVAAVSSLAGSRTRAQASREDAAKPEPEPQRPAWAAEHDGNPLVRTARYPKGDQDRPPRDPRHRDHGDHTDHGDQHSDSYLRTPGHSDTIIQ